MKWILFILITSYPQRTMTTIEYPTQMACHDAKDQYEENNVYAKKETYIECIKVEEED